MNQTTTTSSTWNTALPDWERRVIAGESLLPPGLPLNIAEAQKAERIFNLLRLPDVPGQPTLADAAGEWFREAVRALFGSYDPDTGVRHLSELFILVPKKNSKTTYSAALMLTAMLMSRRPRAEFLLVAPTQEVADLAFRQAVGMIEADSVLRKKCHIQEHIKRISYRTSGAFLKVKSFDPRVVTGSKPAGVLLDETHVIAESHDADRVLGQLRGGLISQPEGFLVQITTQSERPPSGVFASELRAARAVREGRLRAPTLPLLYEFPPTVNWRDTKNWPMVLPNLGRSINLARLETEFAKATESGPEELRRWASQHLNVEVGLALLSDSWGGADHWERRGDPDLTLDEVLLRSEVITIGIDGGGNDDLLGVAVLGRERGGNSWLHWGHAWARPSVLERRKIEAPRLRDFEADGDVSIVPEGDDDVAAVVAIVDRVERAGLLDKVGVDAVGIGAIFEALTDDAAPVVERDRVVAVPQGWRLNGAIQTVERRLATGSFLHGGSRMMAWSVGNAKVEPKGNAIAITKQASGRGKIDPLMALFDAATLMSLNPEARDGGSFWQALAGGKA